MTGIAQLVTQGELIQSVERSLLIDARTPALDETLFSQALRRASHVLAPCLRYQLERAVCLSLTPLAPPDFPLASKVEEALERLIVHGEIAELHSVDDTLRGPGAIVLRPLPPRFVRRANSTIIIIGVAGDEITPLIPSLNARVSFHNGLRSLSAEPGEDLVAALKAIGIAEISATDWLRMPSAESTAAYLARWSEKLWSSPRPSQIEGLTIFAGAGRDFYPKRRVSPGKHSGIFVGRRAQKYGADLWCLVFLENGTPEHIVDLVSEGDRLRPCDVAWRILMALDAQVGAPQQYEYVEDGTDGFLAFFSPIPSWMERRILIDGERVPPDQCLLRFQLPGAVASGLINLLSDRLWLDSKASSTGGIQ